MFVEKFDIQANNKKTSNLYCAGLWEGKQLIIRVNKGPRMPKNVMTKMRCNFSQLAVSFYRASEPIKTELGFILFEYS